MSKKTPRHQRNCASSLLQVGPITSAIVTLPNAGYPVTAVKTAGTEAESAITMRASAAAPWTRSTDDLSGSDQSSSLPAVSKKRLDKFEFMTVDSFRFIVKTLNEQPDLVKGGIFHTLEGSMSGRLRQVEVHNWPLVMAVLQELGVLRHFGAGTTITWQVACISFYDEMVSEEWLERAIHNHQKHADLVEEARRMKLHVNSLEEQLQTVSALKSEEIATDPDQALVVQVANLLEDIEQLKVRDQANEQTLADLKRKLMTPPKPTSADVARYLAELRTSQTKS